MSAERPIVVTGGRGMMGSSFLAEAEKIHQIESPDSAQLNLLDPDKVASYLRTIRPRYVINFAAWTDVNKAEEQRGDKSGSVYRTNALAVHQLEELSSELDFRLIQISTDMARAVRPGQSAPFDEKSKPHLKPDEMGWYAFTKAMGEYGIDISENMVVPIIYPIRPGYEAKGYLAQAIKAYRDGKKLKYFGDQKMNNTLDSTLNAVILELIENPRPGIYPVATRDITTPHELVSKAIEAVFGIRDVVEKVSLKEMVDGGKLTSYRYPFEGGLDGSGTEKRTGIKMPTTDDIVDLVARAEKARS